MQAKWHVVCEEKYCSYFTKLFSWIILDTSSHIFHVLLPKWQRAPHKISLSKAHVIVYRKTEPISMVTAVHSLNASEQLIILIFNLVYLTGLFI